MPKQYSRKEFYDLVWSKPITHLAKDFGLSDVAIHKICKKHNIPNPPLGYWAKKAHGKAVTQTPLPRSSKDVADTILIVEGSFLSEPDSLRSAREQARINASAPEAQPPAARHSIVERTISSLIKAKVDARGLPAPWKAALSQWRGIYFVYDTGRRAGYVGSAYGAENILGRWQEYSRTGHAGNKGLKDSEPGNLRFSILQRTSPDLVAEEVIALESSWKQRLHTREFGLNRN